jgi:hypothetical protein
LVVVCSKCGRKNRVPESGGRRITVRCGNCATEINFPPFTESTVPPHPSGASTGQGGGRTLLHTLVHRIANVLDLLVIVSIFLLFFAGSPWSWKMPHTFYTLVRFAVCGTAVYLAFGAWWSHLRVWTPVMGGIAILFNPLAPVHLSRSFWQILDIATALVLCFFVFETRWTRNRRIC